MGQAVGESERFVVPRKPTKVGPPGRSSRWIVDRETGREGTSVQGQRHKWQRPEIGDEPNTSRNGPEATEGAARQSEGIADIPLLRVVRQGVSQGCTLVRVPA